jgi:hypothetical protein
MADRSKLGRRHTALAGLLGVLSLLSGACDGDVVEVDPDGALTATRCFSGIMYLVQGDLFTRLSSAQQTIETRGRGSSSGPTGWNPDIEPRAKSQVQLKGYNGEARLLWNDAVVQRFALNQAFLESDDVGILVHDTGDGRRVELHVYARGSCEFPPEITTRAEIEALEGKAPSSDAGAVP